MTLRSESLTDRRIRRTDDDVWTGVAIATSQKSKKDKITEERVDPRDSVAAFMDAILLFVPSVIDFVDNGNQTEIC